MGLGVGGPGGVDVHSSTVFWSERTSGGRRLGGQGWADLWMLEGVPEPRGGPSPRGGCAGNAWASRCVLCQCCPARGMPELFEGRRELLPPGFRPLEKFVSVHGTSALSPARCSLCRLRRRTQLVEHVSPPAVVRLLIPEQSQAAQRVRRYRQRDLGGLQEESHVLVLFVLQAKGQNLHRMPRVALPPD